MFDCFRVLAHTNAPFKALFTDRCNLLCQDQGIFGKQPPDNMMRGLFQLLHLASHRNDRYNIGITIRHIIADNQNRSVALLH